jgi:hypothetical protein
MKKLVRLDVYSNCILLLICFFFFLLSETMSLMKGLEFVRDPPVFNQTLVKWLRQSQTNNQYSFNVIFFKRLKSVFNC